MRRLTTVRRGVLQDHAQEASSEALDLWRNFEKLKHLGFKPQRPKPKHEMHAQQLNLELPSPDHHDKFLTIAPKLSTVIAIMCELELTAGVVKRREKFKPSGLTMLFSKPKQYVPWHQDYSGAPGNTVSAVATLSGKGLFEVKDAYGIGIVEDVSVEAGDVHTLFNPADHENRRMHAATSTGQDLRISAGFQIPIVPLQQ